MSDFSFSRKRDGSYQLDKYDGASAVLSIPSEYEGHPVTSIADRSVLVCACCRRKRHKQQSKTQNQTNSFDFFHISTSIFVSGLVRTKTFVYNKLEILYQLICA